MAVGVDVSSVHSSLEVSAVLKLPPVVYVIMLVAVTDEVLSVSVQSSELVVLEASAVVVVGYDVGEDNEDESVQSSLAVVDSTELKGGTCVYPLDAAVVVVASDVEYVTPTDVLSSQSELSPLPEPFPEPEVGVAVDVDVSP